MVTCLPISEARCANGNDSHAYSLGRRSYSGKEEGSCEEGRQEGRQEGTSEEGPSQEGHQEGREEEGRCAKRLKSDPLGLTRLLQRRKEASGLPPASFLSLCTVLTTTRLTTTSTDLGQSIFRPPFRAGGNPVSLSTGQRTLYPISINKVRNRSR